MSSPNSRGTMNRRRFVQQVGALGIAATHALGTLARGQDALQSPFQAVELNHISLDTTHTERSREFYQALFGMTPIDHGRGGRAAFLHFEEGFLNLRPADLAGMNHFCLSITEFDVNSVYARLESMDLEPWIQGGGRLLHVRDPDGINVQVQEVGHGWRRRRNELANADKGTFATLRLHHLTLNVTDLARSCDFYRDLFGLTNVAAADSQGRCVLGVGHSFLELRKAETPGMHHYAYAITDFDAERAATKLAEARLELVKSDESGTLSFRDPQDLLVQVTSVDQRLG